MRQEKDCSPWYLRDLSLSTCDSLSRIRHLRAVSVWDRSLLQLAKHSNAKLAVVSLWLYKQNTQLPHLHRCICILYLKTIWETILSYNIQVHVIEMVIILIGPVFSWGHKEWNGLVNNCALTFTFDIKNFVKGH